LFVYVCLLGVRVMFVYVRLFKNVGERSFSPSRQYCGGAPSESIINARHNTSSSI